jgi:hypothetical protein
VVCTALLANRRQDCSGWVARPPAEFTPTRALNQFGDLFRQYVDVLLEGLDGGQHAGQQKHVVIPELSSQRLT